jgi:hypothetical protein
MVLYTCPKCSKEFTNKAHFEIHINRKTSCNEEERKIEKNLFCPICNKLYSSKRSLNKHIDTVCMVKKFNEENKKKEEDEKNFLKNQLALLQEFIQKNSNTKIEDIVSSSTQQTINGNIVNGNVKNLYNNNTQVINNNYFSSDTLPFGKEDVSILTHKLFLNMFKYMTIDEIHNQLIELINYNKKYKNNQNVVRYNKKLFAVLEQRNKINTIKIKNLDDLTELYIKRNIDIIDDKIGVLQEENNPEILAIEKKVEKYNKTTDKLIDYLDNRSGDKQSEETVRKIKDNLEKLIIEKEINKELL